MHSLLAAALRYAAMGWPVFLLGRSKRPVALCANCKTAGTGHDRETCECLTCHGFYAATTDPQRLSAMFAVVRAPMLAVRTGSPSGLLVVDVDPGHGGFASLETLTRNGWCPPTRWVRTGSGGLHLYYRHPGGWIPGSQSKLAPGIDIRGDGGYAALPPSPHPRTGRPYEWRTGHEMVPAQAALVRELARLAAPAPTPTGAVVKAGTAFPYPDRLIGVLLQRLRDAPQGRRRVTLFGCARGAARMVAAGAIDRRYAVAALLHTATVDAGQDERDARNAINGGFAAEGVRL